MRAVLPSVQDAILDNDTYRMLVGATVWPSRIFFDAVTSDFPIAGADAVGIDDDPMPQSLYYSTANDLVVTFVNDGGTLKRATQGNSSLTSTGISITGNPSIYEGTLFYISGGAVYKRTITDGSYALSGATLVITPSLDPLAVHAVSATECVVVCDGDGGLKIVASDSSEGEGRFMFPRLFDYTDDDHPLRTLTSIALFSGAFKLNNDIFFYISNNATGAIEAIKLDNYTGIWGDIWTSLPSDIDAGLADLRIVHAYSRNGTGYLVTQFQRTETLQTALTYSLILTTADGKFFSVDPFTAVSNLGYRFHAVVGGTKLFLGNCNRICYSDVTYYFDGAEGLGLSLEIPHTDIIEFNDSSMTSGTMQIAAGDDYYATHPYVIEGSLITVDVGYETTDGQEYVTYNRYIIDRISVNRRDGSRSLQMSIVHEGMWKLNQLSSPFYIEIFGRSAVGDQLEEESGNVYTAPDTHQLINRMAVDFWGCEPYSKASESIVGVDIISSGGVNYYEAAGAHKLGFRSKELKDFYNLTDNPTIISGSIEVNIFGWSRGSPADTVTLIIITEDDDKKEYLDLTSAGLFPGGGENPIEVTATGLDTEHRLKYIGLVFESSGDTAFCPARVEIMSGIHAWRYYDDPNTPWSQQKPRGIKMPGYYRPYLMFGQKPYNAQNFIATGSFKTSLTFPVVDNPNYYRVGGGLVGLADNGMNFVLGCYNERMTRFEIVKVRDGVDTLLASWTPGFSVDEEYEVMFMHKDGRFSVWGMNVDTWEEVASYEWTDDDSWMFTSKTSSKKCGIYGQADTPAFYIIAYDSGENDDGKISDGVGALPPWYQFDDFPASGEVIINGSIYTYANLATVVVRGPYQYRQNNPDYSEGAGLENRDYDDTKIGGDLAGSLIAIDDGACYLVSDTNWNPYGDENRTRWISLNEMIGNIYHTCAQKTYTTGGLHGMEQISGERTSHPTGSICMQRLRGELMCLSYFGVSGSSDLTVANLIHQVASLAGARVVFSGDTVSAAMGISGETLIGSFKNVESFDIEFEAGAASSIVLRTNVNRPGTDTKVEVQIDDLGGGDFEIALVSTPSDTILGKIAVTVADTDHRYRIVFHENFVSIHIDDRWIYTFYTESLRYPSTCSIWLDGSFTATNLKLVELCDWREAIYIDLETNGMSVVQDIIQERPVEIYPRSDGSISFWYEIVRDIVTPTREPGQHSESRGRPSGASSDAIIYGSKDAKTHQYSPFLKEHGFSTKVYRMPNLDSGAGRAAKILLERLFEERSTHDLTIRPDVRLEPGDKFEVDYVATGTQLVQQMTLIVTDVRLHIDDRSSSMGITGREDYT